jgi:hypothetical protein
MGQQCQGSLKVRRAYKRSSRGTLNIAFLSSSQQQILLFHLCNLFPNHQPLVGFFRFCSRASLSFYNHSNSLYDLYLRFQLHEPKMIAKTTALAALVAVAYARFGQEQVPIQAIADVQGGAPGAAQTIAGAAISDLLAATNACDKLKRGDQIVAELGGGADAIAAAIGMVAAEKNFNPFAQSIPTICSDPTLPATEELRGITPLIDPAVAGSDAANALSASSKANPLDATGKSIADLLTENGFTNFISQGSAGGAAIVASSAAAGGAAVATSTAAAVTSAAAVACGAAETGKAFISLEECQITNDPQLLPVKSPPCPLRPPLPLPPPVLLAMLPQEVLTPLPPVSTLVFAHPPSSLRVGWVVDREYTLTCSCEIVS